MKQIQSTIALLAAIVAVANITSAELQPNPTPEQKILKFLWSAPGSTEEKTDILYSVVEDSYKTRLTFTRDNKFKGSDGRHGTWSFESGKFILTCLDASITIKYDPSALQVNEIKGIVTSKGREHGKHVILSIPPQ